MSRMFRSLASVVFALVAFGGRAQCPVPPLSHTCLTEGAITTHTERLEVVQISDPHALCTQASANCPFPSGEYRFTLAWTKIPCFCDSIGPCKHYVSFGTRVDVKLYLITGSDPATEVALEVRSAREDAILHTEQQLIDNTAKDGSRTGPQQIIVIARPGIEERARGWYTARKRFEVRARDHANNETTIACSEPFYLALNELTERCCQTTPPACCSNGVSRSFTGYADGIGDWSGMIAENKLGEYQTGAGERTARYEFRLNPVLKEIFPCWRRVDLYLVRVVNGRSEPLACHRFYTPNEPRTDALCTFTPPGSDPFADVWQVEFKDDFSPAVHKWRFEIMSPPGYTVYPRYGECSGEFRWPLRPPAEYGADAVIGYRDTDQDGYGDTYSSHGYVHPKCEGGPEVCGSGISWVDGRCPLCHAPNHLDCDDTDPAVHPGAIEVADGVDNDCNIHTPVDTEFCDGHDNDGDGAVDEAVGTLYYLDRDGDGTGDPASRRSACSAPGPTWVVTGGDCQDSDPAINTSMVEFTGMGWDRRISDPVDDDCDGRLTCGPADTEQLLYLDEDGDGFGAIRAAETADDAVLYVCGDPYGTRSRIRVDLPGTLGGGRPVYVHQPLRSIKDVPLFMPDGSRRYALVTGDQDDGDALRHPLGDHVNDCLRPAGGSVRATFSRPIAALRVELRRPRTWEKNLCAVAVFDRFGTRRSGLHFTREGRLTLEAVPGIHGEVRVACQCAEGSWSTLGTAAIRTGR
jgi:hypothetical protein